MFNWMVAATIIIALLLFDLRLFSKRQVNLSLKQNTIISLIYFIVANLFSIFIYKEYGYEGAKEYLAGYLIEKAMAFDNIFIISLIFKFFSIPLQYQKRVLTWGIIGVVVFRAIIIVFSGIILNNLPWILYIFAVILIFTGVKILQGHQDDLKVENLLIYKLLKKYGNLTNDLSGDSFLVKINQKYYITPLLAALIVIEIIDIIFAIDSLPAIFAITNNQYIIYTSNIFAVLGLRSLYFCLNGMMERFKYIKYSLGFILIFIGIKIVAAYFMEVPIYIALGVIVTSLLIGIFYSIVNNKIEENSKLE